jgi:drug/metabolite transporter (DMT)-like permease
MAVLGDLIRREIERESRSDMSAETSSRPAKWKVLLAFGIIYFVWGSTFLAIRVGVREVPPFLLAGVRFLLAGSALYGWMRLRGTPSPSRREWGAATLLAVLIFVFDYGMLFWAERRVPSGIAAVMMATIPVFMALSEILIIKTQQLTVRLAVTLLIGVGGVAVLVSRSVSFGDAPIDAVGACALIAAAISWSVASVLTRKLPLPAAKAMSSGAQMLAGGVLLTITAGLLGEFHGFNVHAVSGRAWGALAYLTVAGSIVGYTAYIWLIHHESPTKVGTYAYVNPVIAVLVGYFLGGESIGSRTIFGTLLVLVSVVILATSPGKKVPVASKAQETQAYAEAVPDE